MSGSVKLNLLSGGSKTILAPDSASDETITLPAGTKTLATVENFTSTGIDDNAISTAITINAGGDTIIDGGGNTLTLRKPTGAAFNFNDSTQIRAGIHALNGADGLVFRTGSAQTERMRIDSSGRVTTPYQPHIFGTPGNGTAGSSGMASIFSVKTSRGLSFSNSRVTVPVAGVYMITYQTICSDNTGRYDTQVLVNGVVVTYGLNETNGTGHHQRTHSFCMYLNANDYVQWYNARYYSNGAVFDYWTTASVTLLG